MLSVALHVAVVLMSTSWPDEHRVDLRSGRSCNTRHIPHRLRDSPCTDTVTFFCVGQGPASCANIVEKYVFLSVLLHVAVVMKKSCVDQRSGKSFMICDTPLRDINGNDSLPQHAFSAGVPSSRVDHYGAPPNRRLGCARLGVQKVRGERDQLGSFSRETN